MISVILPLHNKADYVEQTLRSLQFQTYQKWEALVVENHSSDDGPRIVEKFADKEPRVQLLRPPPSVTGPGAARNYGLKNASGDWVLFLDSDDLIMPEHLESMLEVAEKSREEITVVASNWREFRAGEWEWDTEHETGITEALLEGMDVRTAGGSSKSVSRISVQNSSIAYAPWAIHCGLVRRKVFTQERRWVEALDCHPSEDTAFWFRILHGNSVGFTRQATALYRTETENFRNIHNDLEPWSIAISSIHRENVNFLESQGGMVSANQAESLMRIWSKIGQRSLRSGSPKLAEESYQRADDWNLLTAWKFPSIILRKLLGCRRFDNLIMRFSKNNREWRGS